MTKPLPYDRGSIRSGDSQAAVSVDRRGLAPLAVACTLILGICALRFLFQADEAHSWFLGHSFGSACWFRAHYGIPCPNCGMTRSLILAAHGALARSMRLAPGGMATLLAAIVVSLMLVALGVAMLQGRPTTVARLQSALRVTVLTSASLAAIVWLGGWALAVAHVLRSQ
jgi:hypothetical protein